MLGHHRMVSGLRRSHNANQGTLGGTAQQSYEAMRDESRARMALTTSAQDLIHGGTEPGSLASKLHYPDIRTCQVSAAPAYGYAEYTPLPQHDSNCAKRNEASPGMSHAFGRNQSSTPNNRHAMADLDFMNPSNSGVSGSMVAQRRTEGCGDDTLCAHIDALDKIVPLLLQEHRLLKEAVLMSGQAHQDNLVQFM